MNILISIEYWTEGMTADMQVDKSEFYNSYLTCYRGYVRKQYSDGTIVYYWRDGKTEVFKPW